MNRLIAKSLLIFVILLSASLNANAGYLEKIWGQPSPNSFTAFPFAYHFQSFGHRQPNDYVFLFAGNYRGITGGTFLNSQRHRVYFLGFDREFYQSKMFSVGYLLAIMSGYRKALRKELGPVLGHDPGPLVALTGKLHLTPHLSLEMAWFGVGVLGGVNIRF